MADVIQKIVMAWTVGAALLTFKLLTRVQPSPVVIVLVIASLILCCKAIVFIAKEKLTRDDLQPARDVRAREPQIDLESDRSVRIDAINSEVIEQVLMMRDSQVTSSKALHDDIEALRQQVSQLALMNEKLYDMVRQQAQAEVSLPSVEPSSIIAEFGAKSAEPVGRSSLKLASHVDALNAFYELQGGKRSLALMRIMGRHAQEDPLFSGMSSASWGHSYETLHLFLILLSRVERSDVSGSPEPSRVKLPDIARYYWR